MISIYSHACILRPSIHPEELGLILKVVLKWRGIYIYWKHKSCATDGQS